MPELPEVETVARDLRPLITGADDRRRARRSWARTLREHRRRRRSPTASPAGRIEARRAARRSSSSSSCRRRRFLTIHLKMTGQLFVVPAGRPRGSVRPARARARGRPRDPVPRHPQVRPGRAVRCADDDDPFAAIGPEPLADAFTRRARSGAGSAAARAASSRSSSTSRSSPASATSTPTRRSGRPASTRCGRPGRSGRPTSAACGCEIRADPRRGRRSGAARRSTTTPRPTATARCRSTSHVYQRTGEPCPRCGRPIRRIVVGGRATHFCSWCQRLPAADRAGAAAILRTMSRAASRRGPALDASCRAGRGASGRRRRRRAGAAAQRPRDAGRADAAERPRPGAAAARASVGRLTRCRSFGSSGVRREVGTFVILDDITAAIALGDRIGLVGPNGAGKTTLLRIAAGRDEPDGGDGPAQARADARPARPGVALRRGVHGRAGPAGGGPPRRRAPRGDGRASSRALEHAGRVDGAGLRRPPAPSSRSSAATRSTSGSTRRCPASGFTRDEWAQPPTALSGGEQTRAALARLVIADPDLLLLDEPTNHLDIGALEWLEEHLRRRARLAPRRLPRPGVPRRDRDPDLGAPRPAADRVPRRLQRLPPPARGARRAGGQGRRHARPSQIAREKELVQRYRSATASSARCTSTRRASSGSRPSGSRRRRRRGSCGCPAGALAGGGAVALRRDRRPGRGARRRLPARARRRRPPTARRRRAAARRDGAVPRRASAATGSGSSGRTAPARRRSCGRSPATCRRSTAR